ncbi:hypothetical protein [Streptomyces klenkii]|uniref:hypothetical protein n=1 Tax=Streptomyces klenkii TaxID=1420899 RepID=UPI00342B8352
MDDLTTQAQAQAQADDGLRQAWASAHAAEAQAADAAAQARDTGTRGPDDRGERAGGSLALPAVLAVLLVPVALLFGGLAPMATDSCGPDHCSRALDQALSDVVHGLHATFAGTPALLLTAGVLPRRMRYATARRLTAWSALLPPAFVILRVLALPQ